MACVQEIHVNDIGTVFEITLVDCDTPVNISAATETTILFSKPDGTVVEQTAVFTTNGADGKIRYVTVDGDLDVDGKWKLQARVVMPSGAWSSNISGFTVKPNLLVA
jgi:hypothetical protein